MLIMKKGNNWRRVNHVMITIFIIAIISIISVVKYNTEKEGYNLNDNYEKQKTYSEAGDQSMVINNDQILKKRNKILIGLDYMKIFLFLNFLVVVLFFIFYYLPFAIFNYFKVRFLLYKTFGIFRFKKVGNIRL